MRVRMTDTICIVQMGDNSVIFDIHYLRYPQLQTNFENYLHFSFQFDSSIDRNKPFDFTLGVGQVIQGWDAGVLGMCVSEKRYLCIE